MFHVLCVMWSEPAACQPWILPKCRDPLLSLGALKPLSLSWDAPAEKSRVPFYLSAPTAWLRLLQIKQEVPHHQTTQPSNHTNIQTHNHTSWSPENGHVQDHNQFVKDQVTSQKHTQPKLAPREIKLTVPAEVWLRHAALSFSSSSLTLQRPSLTPPGSGHLPLPVKRRPQRLKTLTDSPASQINQTPPTPPQIRHPLFHLTRADSIKQQIEHGPETAREEEGCKAAGLSAPPTAAQFRLLVPMLWGMALHQVRR